MHCPTERNKLGWYVDHVRSYMCCWVTLWWPTCLDTNCVVSPPGESKCCNSLGRIYAEAIKNCQLPMHCCSPQIMCTPSPPPNDPLPYCHESATQPSLKFYFIPLLSSHQDFPAKTLPDEEHVNVSDNDLCSCSMF